MARYQIQWVRLSNGAEIPAYKMVCPQCEAFDLEVDINTSAEPYVARCTEGHEWLISMKGDA